MKVTISRLFEISKSLGTQAGKELSDALQYLADLGEMTARGLTNSLTFEDNLDCQTKRLTVRNNTLTVIGAPTGRRITRIYVDRVISPYFVVTGFGWQISGSGQVVAKFLFDGSPPATQDITVDITIFYG